MHDFSWKKSYKIISDGKSKWTSSSLISAPWIILAPSTQTVTQWISSGDTTSRHPPGSVGDAGQAGGLSSSWSTRAAVSLHFTQGFRWGFHLFKTPQIPTSFSTNPRKFPKGVMLTSLQELNVLLLWTSNSSHSVLVLFHLYLAVFFLAILNPSDNKQR